MKNHTDCKRQFIQLSRAWYADAIRNTGIVDRITMGFYHKEGGTTGEFEIQWIKLCGSEKPKLSAFNDSWNAMWQFRDVLKAMAAMDGTDPTPDEICKMLISVGVEDNTPDSPYSDKE